MGFTVSPGQPRTSWTLRSPHLVSVSKSRRHGPQGGGWGYFASNIVGIFSPTRRGLECRSDGQIFCGRGKMVLVGLCTPSARTMTSPCRLHGYLFVTTVLVGTNHILFHYEPGDTIQTIPWPRCTPWRFGRAGSCGTHSWPMSAFVAQTTRRLMAVHTAPSQPQSNWYYHFTTRRRTWTAAVRMWSDDHTLMAARIRFVRATLVQNQIVFKTRVEGFKYLGEIGGPQPFSFLLGYSPRLGKSGCGAFDLRRL